MPGNQTDGLSLPQPLPPPPVKLSKSGKFYLLSKVISKTVLNGCLDKIIKKLADQAPPQSKFTSTEKRWSGEPKHTARHFQVIAKTDVLIKDFIRKSLAYPDIAEIRVAVLVISQLEVTNQNTGEVHLYLYIQRELADDPLECGIIATPIETAAFLAQFLESQNNEHPRIEQLTMQMMASSRGEVRRKRIDAYDVGTTTSSLGLHRTIAGSMILAAPAMSGNRTVSVSPHRQSVRSGSSRVSLSDVLQWACERGAGFAQTQSTNVVPSSFLSQMAQPLFDLHKKTPSSVWIEKNELLELVSNYNSEHNTTWSQPASTKTKDKIHNLETLLEFFKEPIQLNSQAYTTDGVKLSTVTNEKTVIFKSNKPVFPFSDALLELRITSKTCKIKLPSFTGSLNSTNTATPPKPIIDILNKYRSFRVVFDSGKALYCSEGAYASTNTKLAVAQLMHIFKPITALGAVTSEKGEVCSTATNFEDESSFHVIETDLGITNPKSVLICDDDTQEWCDYIELSENPTKIRWLHAKVQQIEAAQDKRARKNALKNGATSGLKTPPPKKLLPMLSSNKSSASDLQEVVGQALKNLSRLRITKQDHEFDPRKQRWLTQNCVLPKKSKIKRLRRPASLTSEQLEQRFSNASSDPTALYEVGIVIPNYSLNHLNTEMHKISMGNASQPILQAFWLLSGYMHACLEVGAQPIIFVRP